MVGTSSEIPASGIYGQLFITTDTKQTFMWNGSAWTLVLPVSTAARGTFTELEDCPSSYVEQSGNLLRVNANENGLEFTDTETLAGSLAGYFTDSEQFSAERDPFALFIQPYGLTSGTMLWAYSGFGVAFWGDVRSSILGLTAASWNRTNWAFTPYRGPFGDFTGVSTYLSSDDSGHFRAGGWHWLVYGWVSVDRAQSGQVVCRRQWPTYHSWGIEYLASTRKFRWGISETGNSGTSFVNVDTDEVQPGRFYFVAGYFNPGTDIRIYWASAAESSLHSRTQATTFNSLYAGTVKFGIGAGFDDTGNPASYLCGRIGPFAGWGNVLPEEVETFLSTVFERTKDFFRQTGYKYYALTTPLTSTDWDGDAKAVGTYTIYPRHFGYPANARAIELLVRATWSAAADGNYLLTKSVSTVSNANSAVRAMVANTPTERVFKVPLWHDGSFQVIVAGAGTTSTYLYVTGYYK